MANQSSTKKDYGVEFVNIELKFRPAMYIGKEEELPNADQLGKWLEDMAGNFYRLGFGYNERSSSFTASLTYKGGKTTDTPPCVTQHGKTWLSAVQKLYIVFEVCGGAREGLKFASDALAQLEVYIEDAVDKLMK